MRFKKACVGVLTAVVLGTASSLSFAQVSDTPFDALGEQSFVQPDEYISRGVALPGSKLHTYFMKASRHARPDVAISFTFSGDSLDALQLKSVLEKTGQSNAKFDFATPDPNPDPGFFIGDLAEWTDYCWAINDGPTPGSATFRWTFEYQYTRDTNGDGVKDSDPAWVLVDVEYSDVEWYTAAQPLGECI